MKRIVVKYFGFNEAERHALDTLFRLSESGATVYSPWTPEAPEAPAVLLVDGDSWEAVLELANPVHDGIRLVWVGDAAPAEAWRVFAAPVKWSAVIEALDAEFSPPRSQTLSLDLDLAHDQDMDVHLDGDDDTAPMALDGAPAPTRRVLVVDSGRDARLYLRAKLASAGLYEVDEAVSGADALALLGRNSYHLVTVDLGLTDMDGWQLVKAVDSTRPAIAHLFITGTEPAWRRGLQARFSGAQVYLPKPLDPEKLRILLQNL
ncbi:MAG: response regulator [Polaromonas sp.]|uniref:response regulator n=1 Tax=Polaromonas sp. TaxID=1869339 RepID=UPI0040369687